MGEWFYWGQCILFAYDGNFWYTFDRDTISRKASLNVEAIKKSLKAL